MHHTRGVHQTAKTASKPPTKWHNCIAPQVILHRSAPHRTTTSLYILIYLIIFNIKYIINSLITLVLKRKK